MSDVAPHLDLLARSERLPAKRIRRTPPDRHRVVALLGRVAPLRLAQGAHVGHEPGEVLADAERTEHREHLVLHRARVRRPRQPRGEPVTRRRAALVPLGEAEELATLVWRTERQATSPLVVVAHHARRVESRRVRVREERELVSAQLGLELRHRTRRRVRTVGSEAVPLDEVDADEGGAGGSRRAPEPDEALRTECPVGGLRDPPAMREPEPVVDAARNREVALARVEGPLDHTQPLDELRDHEVGVGVAVGVRVRRLIHRDAFDAHLDVLSLAGVEAPKEDRRRVPLTRRVREKEPGRQRQELLGVASRHVAELADVDGQVARRDGSRATRTPDTHLVDGRRSARRRQRGGRLRVRRARDDGARHHERPRYDGEHPEHART